MNWKYCVDEHLIMNGSLVYWLLLSSLQTFGIEIQLISPVNGKKGNRVSVYRGRKLSSVSKIELFIKARYILLSRSVLGRKYVERLEV